MTAPVWSTPKIWEIVMHSARKQAAVNGSRRRVSAVRARSGGWRYLVLCDQIGCSACYTRITNARLR